MFVEETFEAFVQSTLEAARDAGKFVVKNIVYGQLTMENAAEYTKIAPAIVYAAGEDNTALSPIGAKNDAQIMEFSLNVYIYTTNKYTRRGGTDSARVLLRGVRDTLRGLLYTQADGATEGVARVVYNSQEKIAEEEGVALFLQRYTVKSQDFNDTRRTL